MSDEREHSLVMESLERRVRGLETRQGAVEVKTASIETHLRSIEKSLASINAHVSKFVWAVMLILLSGLLGLILK